MAPKTVLITGSSKGGIGDALARNFHKKGLRVFATARNLAKVQHLKELGLDIIQLDVTDDASIQKAVESVKAITGGSLDILVNNSGGGYSLPMLDTNTAEAKKMFDVNVFALVAVTNAFAPLLIKSKGTIVNIGSVAGVMPIPFQGYYNATKAAVNLLTDQFRLELSPWGVKAINVTTGGIKTKFFENLSTAELPPTSLYYPAKDVIEPILNGSFIENDAMNVEEYAETVVNNALKSNPSKTQWVGSSSTLTWVGATFGWAGFFEFLFYRMMKFPEITKRIKAAEKSD